MKTNRPHRQVRLRVLYIVAALLIIAVGTSYLQPTVVLQPVSTFDPAVAAAHAITLQWPATGQATLGAVGYGTLATEGSQTPLPTASVAKLITALSVLQKYPLQPGQQGPTLTLTSADVALYNQYYAEDGSVALVQAGEQITEYQALEAMMLPSANNMADTLAIWAFGSLTSYATYANQFVLSLGMNQTHIGSDASGFLPDTTSTASDLVTLGLKVLQNPVLAQIVDEPSAVLPVAGTVYNVNALLGTDGIVGIKTGNSDQDGGVYLFAAKDALDANHSVTFVGAIMDQSDLSAALNAALPLLNSAKQNVSLQAIVSTGQTVGHYVTPWGTTVPVLAGNSLQTVVWAGSAPKLTAAIKPQSGSKPSGAVVGSITANGTSVPVILGAPLSQPPLAWRLTWHLLK